MPSKITEPSGASMPILISLLMIFLIVIVILFLSIILSPNLLVSTSICYPPWFWFMGFNLCIINTYSITFNMQTDSSAGVIFTFFSKTLSGFDISK